MIGFFPDPYPDELLYSVCARYSQRVQYLNKQEVMSELFGKRGLSAVVDFPSRLHYFVSILPLNHRYSVKKLINENTLFPFYKLFLPAERLKIIRDEMQGKSRNNLQMRLGLKVKQIEKPKYLRYCPACVKDDRSKYRETYWHRIHQLGGIIICSTHHCFLKNSLIKLGKFAGKMFHNAEGSIPSNISKVKYTNAQNEDHQILLKITKDAEWLLSNPSVCMDSKSIRDRYFNIILKQDFAYYNGRVKHDKLINSYQTFFSTKVFKSIGKISKANNWLSSLVDKGNINKIYNPVRHLLLMTFLGITAKDFFTSFVEFKPFADAPYPCLNITSEHYRQLCIQGCRVFDNTTKGKRFRGPLAVFSCECGFIYQRLGPDKSEEDKFRYSSIREYGFVWENKFAELWADLSLSLIEIARRTGISQTSVGRHAIRLSLPMNSKETLSLEGYKRHRNPKIPFSEMLQNYRKIWLQTRLDNPNLSRKKLLNTKNFIYFWLKRNDSKWFENNLPDPAKVCRKREWLNWTKIDVNLSEKIQLVCCQIRNSVEPPIRVSISEIIRRSGHKGWIDKRRNKLPLTTKIINVNLETSEEFMIRKISIATKVYVAEKKLPSLAQFKVRALVKNLTSKNSPKIQEAIKTALTEIENSLSL